VPIDKTGEEDLMNCGCHRSVTVSVSSLCFQCTITGQSCPTSPSEPVHGPLT
jgi:hypothetical protein